MNKFFTGIGSRQTPPHILPLLYELGQIAADNGWILRSGAAYGADEAFEAGCDDKQGRKQIFMPWLGYNDNPSTLLISHPGQAAIASQIHKRWNALSSGAKSMMSRNVCQVLGPDLKTPSRCVICYTPDGCETFEKYSIKTGGTGMAISVASIRDIPVFNLKNNLRYEEAKDFLLSQ